MALDLNVQLTPHFALWEFVISQTAERNEIDNTPSEEIVENLLLLCKEILEPAREDLGSLRVSSGYRCRALNTAIRGSRNSAHISGFAADIIPVEVSNLAFAKWVEANRKFDQLILEFGTIIEPAWIHVSCDPRERNQILRITSAETKKVAKL